MPYLALDTSTAALTIAVGERGKLLGEASTQLSRNHSVKLMPLVESLLNNLDIRPEQLQGFVVGRGPGSYTGVRIAVTAAKALAYAMNLPLVGVSSLDGLARHGQMSDALVVPLIDARRRQAYTAFYEIEGGQFVKIQEDKLMVLDDIVKASEPGALGAGRRGCDSLRPRLARDHVGGGADPAERAGGAACRGGGARTRLGGRDAGC